MNGKDLTEATDQLIKETTTTKTEESSWSKFIPQGGSKKTTTTKKTEIIRNDKAANGTFSIKGYS